MIGHKSFWINRNVLSLMNNFVSYIKFWAAANSCYQKTKHLIVLAIPKLNPKFVRSLPPSFCLCFDFCLFWPYFPLLKTTTILWTTQIFLFYYNDVWNYTSPLVLPFLEPKSSLQYFHILRKSFYCLAVSCCDRWQKLKSIHWTYL